MPEDIRREIFSSIACRTVTAVIIADERGTIAGAGRACREAGMMGVAVPAARGDGALVVPGDEIMRIAATPIGIALAEEKLMGFIAKPSGIATSARAFVERAGSRMTIVCGAWKKMPPGEKEAIRDAVAAGGARSRITNEPFVYLDKNYSAMLGGIRRCLAAVRHLDGMVKVVQLKGRYGAVAVEARDAVEGGARILFIDTGRPEDVAEVSGELRRIGRRDSVDIAFGGGVTLQRMDALMAYDIDILDVGRSIVDAPLLDMRMEIAGT